MMQANMNEQGKPIMTNQLTMTDTHKTCFGKGYCLRWSILSLQEICLP